MVEKLVGLIRETKAAYLALGELEKQKRVALITLDLDELGEIERKQDPILLKMRGLDARREELLGGFDMAGEKFSKAVEKLPYSSEEQKRLVQEEYLALKEAILSLNETMESNSAVAKDYEKCFEDLDIDALKEATVAGRLDVLL